MREGVVLFHGDFEHAHQEAVGWRAVDGLAVLLLRWPDDGSGAGYEIFETYTPEQMKFAREEAELLATEIERWVADQNDIERWD
jgi:hypothetical protein